MAGLCHAASVQTVGTIVSKNRQKATLLIMTSDHSEDISTLGRELGALLISRGLHITAAESCTGGLLAACFTDVAGASSWFRQSWVTYSNEAKISCVGVNETTLEKYGAVSEQTVLEMANGARLKAGADIAVAISGIAGPDGGSDEKPVGTVWIGWSVGDQRLDAEHAVFDGNRQQVRSAALLGALRGTIIRLS